MKKLLGCLFALVVMTGCGSSEPKTTTCSGTVDGGEIKSVINAEGDDVTTEEIVSTTDLSTVGLDASTLSEEEKQTLIKTIEDSSGMKDIKGITLSVSLEGNTMTTKANINYKEADMTELQKADLVDAGFGNTISLEKTVENYKAEGLTCK